MGGGGSGHGPYMAPMGQGAGAEHGAHPLDHYTACMRCEVTRMRHLPGGPCDNSREARHRPPNAVDVAQVAHGQALQVRGRE